MDIERIKEIQQETAYPESKSVQQALLKVWNECEQSPERVSVDAVVSVREGLSDFSKFLSEYELKGNEGVYYLRQAVHSIDEAKKNLDCLQRQLAH